MAMIEQAVFTSAPTHRATGYQLIGRSPGLAEDDARELAVWGPSHDSLLDLGPDAASINFHPLPSGAYCVSRTVSAGFEYSGRGGHRVYTQSLILPPEVLQRFANNAFAVVRAAMAGGMFQVFDPVPSCLPAIMLVGGATPVEQNLLARITAQFGADRLAQFIQAAMDSECLAVAADEWNADLIAGLLNCLPPHVRPEYPFSTGLKHSSRRPFRVLGLSSDPAEHRWISQCARVTLLDFTVSNPMPTLPLDGWPRFVGRVLATRRTSLLAAEFAKRHTEFTTDDLHALGLQLLEEVDASELRGGEPESAESDGEPAVSTESSSPPTEPHGLQRAHAAHRQFQKSGATGGVAATRPAAPSTILHSDSPEVVEKLEHLDDLVFDAINGEIDAAEALREFWPQLVAELGEEMLVESREQYLRYAMTLWQNGAESGAVRNPTRAIQALDVLCLLFNQI